MGYICEARRDAGVEDCRELGACVDDDVPPLCAGGVGVGVTFRGDTGTEVISGAISVNGLFERRRAMRGRTCAVKVGEI